MVCAPERRKVRRPANPLSSRFLLVNISNETQPRYEWNGETLPICSTSVVIRLSIFFVLAVSVSVANILLQHISITYHWTLAQAGYLFTMKAGVGLFLYTVLVPCGLYILTQWRKQPKTQANVQGAKISAILVCFGTLTIGLSTKRWMLISGP